MGTKKPIIFCLPGAEFKQRFFESWIETQKVLAQQEINFYVFTHYSSDIYGCRNSMMLKGGSQDPSNIVPFGDLEYDRMIWIDSDQGFRPMHITRMIEHEESIVSGVSYLNSNPRGCFGYWMEETMEDGSKRHGFKYMNIPAIDQAEKNKDGLIEVDFSGFGFMMIKQGVLEAMDYPWFQTTTKWVVDSFGRDIPILMGEDIGWCYRAKQAGFKIHVDPEIVVQHVKPVLLGPEYKEDGTRV